MGKPSRDRLLLQDATLADVLKRFSDLTPSNTGASMLDEEIAYVLFEALRCSNSRVRDLWRAAEYTAREIHLKYFMVDKDWYKK